DGGHAGYGPGLRRGDAAGPHGRVSRGLHHLRLRQGHELLRVFSEGHLSENTGPAAGDGQRHHGGGAAGSAAHGPGGGRAGTDGDGGLSRPQRRGDRGGSGGDPGGIRPGGGGLVGAVLPRGRAGRRQLHPGDHLGGGGGRREIKKSEIGKNILTSLGGFVKIPNVPRA